MIASERVVYIMRRINELGVVNLKDIAAQLGTSETTVRRDFEKLEQQGKLRRVQGGATTSGGPESLLDSAQLTTRLKTNVHVPQKQLVGSWAAAQVQEGLWLSQGWWERQGRVSLGVREFNHVLWMMNVKNRFPSDWRDRHEVAATHQLTLGDLVAASLEGLGAPAKPEG